MDSITTPMTVKAFANGLEVIGSGTLHVTKDTNPYLMIGDLRVEFIFINDATNTNARVEREKITDKALKYKVFNFSNALGQGVLSPLPVGEIGNKHISVSVWTWVPDPLTNTSILSYVVYFGEKQ